MTGTQMEEGRIVIKSTAELESVKDNIFSVDYHTPGGIILRVRKSYIGADPHNSTPYELAGQSPKQAFNWYQKCFGEAPKNNYQYEELPDAWEVGTPTPHFKRGDSDRAYRMLSALVWMVGGKKAPATRTLAQESLTLRGMALTSVGGEFKPEETAHGKFIATDIIRLIAEEYGLDLKALANS